MRLIGITGGSSLFKLGPAAEIRLFFDCIKSYVTQLHQEEDWSVLTDRLYKRYLRLEDLDAASKKMCKVQEIFEKLDNQSIDWSGHKINESSSKINIHGKNLKDIFCAYFDAFFYCILSAKENFNEFKNQSNYEYEPVMIVVADMPWYFLEKQRPLSDYDNLEGDPFWFVK